MDLSADLRIELPEDALALLSILDTAGFEAWAVGGFVRDALLGRACSDIDIACSAMWADTRLRTGGADNPRNRGCPWNHHRYLRGFGFRGYDFSQRWTV